MKKIIILVDVQNGFVKTDYAEETFVNVVDLMQRELFDVVIATKYWNVPDSIIWRLMGWKDLCTEQEQALRPEIADYVHHVVEKNTYSSINPEMVELLKEVNDGELPEYVYVLGFDTECCVLTTATDLFEMGIRPLLLEKYSGSHDGPRFHDAGVISMEHLIGPRYIITDMIKNRSDLDAIEKRIMESF